MTRRQFLSTGTISLGTLRRRVSGACPAAVLPTPPRGAGPWKVSTILPTLYTPAQGETAFTRTTLDRDQNVATLLSQAYAILKGRPPNDPGGLIGQSAIHQYYCGGAGPDVHQDSTFLLFHRWFLYFHERSIACALKHKNVSVTVPYWKDILTSDDAAPYPSQLVGSAFEPLPVSATRSEYESGALDASVMLFGLQGVTSAVDDPLFSAYQLIIPWHNAAHNYIGSAFSGHEVMCSVPDSAADPLFYVFHSTADAVLESWRRSSCGHSAPCPQYLPQSDPCWTFWDALQNTWVTVSASSVYGLSYDYSPGFSLEKRQPRIDPFTYLDVKGRDVKIPPDGLTLSVRPDGGNSMTTYTAGPIYGSTHHSTRQSIHTLCRVFDHARKPVLFVRGTEWKLVGTNVEHQTGIKVKALPGGNLVIV